MIHFVRVGPIPGGHLDYLIRYWDQQNLDYELHEERLAPDQIIAGHCYVTCSSQMVKGDSPRLSDLFQVQLPHNLTGLKGINFDTSGADLNILAGPRVPLLQGLDLDSPRFVIGGYAKWDTIYQERFLKQQRREELGRDHGYDLGAKWVCFYPTGPNKMVSGNLHKTLRLYQRLADDMGNVEFFLLNHARNPRTEHTRLVLEEIEEAGLPRVHIIDGADTLHYITACDLFITDIASAVVTAMSMDKPIIFMQVKFNGKVVPRTTAFQQAPLLREVRDFGDYVRDWVSPPGLRRLFDECVAFDDADNCSRITTIIRSSFARWAQSR